MVLVSHFGSQIEHSRVWLILKIRNIVRNFCFRPHPKDGKGNVFSLSTPGGGVYSAGGVLSRGGGVISQGGYSAGEVLSRGVLSPCDLSHIHLHIYICPRGRYASCVHTGGFSCLGIIFIS